MNFANTELLQIADSVAREKNINKESVIEAMEQAIEVSSKKKYGNDHEIKVIIDRKTGEIKIFRVREIVKMVENYLNQISLEDALLTDIAAQIGGQILERLPSIDLARGTAQSTKQIILQKIGLAEKERQYNDFKDRVGEIMNGVIKRVETKKMDVDLGKAEGVLMNNSLIAGEIFKRGDRIKVSIESVRRDDKGPQIYLSRTNEDFVAMLFKQEVPEIYDNLIEVKAVSRDPGSRCKIAVYTEDNSIDAVGSCVGIRGARVQAVISELKGEKIDIILWSSDPAKFVVNALTPAEVSKVVIDKERKRIEVIVPSDNLSVAIGRRGQNVRLASQLTGWGIDVLTEEQESKRRLEEFNNLSKKFTKELKIDEMMANLLTAEGFMYSNEIANADIEELTDIKGFDKELAIELKNRAREFVYNVEAKNLEELKRLGVDKKFIEDLDNDTELAISLAEIGCKTLEDLAYISLTELKENIDNTRLSESELEKLVIKAQNLTNNK